MALPTYVQEGMPWHLHKTFRVRGRIAVRIRAADETPSSTTKPNNRKEINRKEINTRPAYAPSTAVSPVAIHLGDHGTYEPATIIIEQHSQQQTTRQVVVRKFRLRKIETTEAMARMKRVQRFKPTVIGHRDSIQWDGIVKTAIFEGHGRKGDLQHGDLMLQQELGIRKGIISCHAIPIFHRGFGLGTNHSMMGRYREQITMPAHELQLTCGRRVNPIQHYQTPRPHGNQPGPNRKKEPK